MARFAYTGGMGGSYSGADKFELPPDDSDLEVSEVDLDAEPPSAWVVARSGGFRAQYQVEGWDGSRPEIAGILRSGRTVGQVRQELKPARRARVRLLVELIRSGHVRAVEAGGEVVMPEATDEALFLAAMRRADLEQGRG